jgi:hypothetical protein
MLRNIINRNRLIECYLLLIEAAEKNTATGMVSEARPDAIEAQSTSKVVNQLGEYTPTPLDWARASRKNVQG